MTDIHAHILPGVDDGAESWEETEGLLSMAASQGIRQIIATPHFSRRADPEDLRQLCKEAQERAEGLGLSLMLSLGQEILYFEDMIRFLEEGKALTLAESRYVLTEFHPRDSYGRLQRAVRELVTAGYFPVLAHVERYLCLREKGRTEELVQSGAYLQLNAGSLLGGMLDRNTAWCRREIGAGRIHFVATDMHNLSQRPSRLEAAFAQTAKRFGAEEAEGLFGKHQQCILEDRLL